MQITPPHLPAIDANALGNAVSSASTPSAPTKDDRKRRRRSGKQRAVKRRRRVVWAASATAAAVALGLLGLLAGGVLGDLASRRRPGPARGDADPAGVPQPLTATQPVSRARCRGTRPGRPSSGRPACGCGRRVWPAARRCRRTAAAAPAASPDRGGPLSVDVRAVDADTSVAASWSDVRSITRRRSGSSSIASSQRAAVRVQHAQALGQLAQLAHVLQPGVQQQRLDEIGRGRPGAIRGRQEVAEQRRHVLQALAQRRRVHLDARQPGVQIAAEAAGGQGVVQRDVGGGDQPGAGADRSAGPDRGHLAVLQHPQQLRLGLQRQLADLVEEQRPAVGAQEGALLIAGGAGEGPAAVAEQRALHQRRRQRRAVDRDEGAGAPALPVHRRRHQLLAGAGLPADQHRQRARRHPPDHLSHAPPAGASRPPGPGRRGRRDRRAHRGPRPAACRPAAPPSPPPAPPPSRAGRPPAGRCWNRSRGSAARRRRSAPRRAAGTCARRRTPAARTGPDRGRAPGASRAPSGGTPGPRPGRRGCATTHRCQRGNLAVVRQRCLRADGGRESLLHRRLAVARHGSLPVPHDYCAFPVSPSHSAGHRGAP